MNMEIKDVLIIGGGPGGLSASIYCVRNGLRTLVIEKGMCGGLVSEAPWIENYLGFEGLKGINLAEKFKDHALKYADINEFEEVLNIEQNDTGFTVKTDKAAYETRALILATGSRHSKLNIPGEEEFHGKGVSYCATCDGFFFREKRVLVVGGGNSAVMDAIHLHDIGCRVSLIHRKNELRAECALKDAIQERGIEIIWNSVLEEISAEGSEKLVRTRNLSTGEDRDERFDGIFISVGEIPNNRLAVEMKLEMDEKGYVKTDRFQRTNMHNVYAVGDITGGVKQIIVACGEGAVAALAAFEELINPYWNTCKVTT
jgi:thioredoxin reductase (NADPH)